MFKNKFVVLVVVIVIAMITMSCSFLGMELSQASKPEAVSAQEITTDPTATAAPTQIVPPVTLDEQNSSSQDPYAGIDGSGNSNNAINIEINVDAGASGAGSAAPAGAEAPKAEAVATAQATVVATLDAASTNHDLNCKGWKLEDGKTMLWVGPAKGQDICQIEDDLAEIRAGKYLWEFTRTADFQMEVCFGSMVNTDTGEKIDLNRGCDPGKYNELTIYKAGTYIFYPTLSIDQGGFRVVDKIKPQ